MMALHVWKNSIFFRALWAQNSGFILLNKVEHPKLFAQFSNINIENFLKGGLELFQKINCFGFARLPWAGHPLFRCIIFSMFHDDKIWDLYFPTKVLPVRAKSTQRRPTRTFYHSLISWFDLLEHNHITFPTLKHKKNLGQAVQAKLRMSDKLLWNGIAD